MASALRLAIAAATALLAASDVAAQQGWSVPAFVRTFQNTSDRYEAHAVGVGGVAYSVVAMRHFASTDGSSEFTGVRYSPTDGVARPLPPLRAAGVHTPPSAAVDGNGDLHVVWATYVANSFWVTVYTRFDATLGTWTTPGPAPGLPLQTNEGQLIALPSGHVVAQAQVPASLISGQVMSVYDPATHTWSAGPLAPRRDGPVPQSAMTGSRVYFTWRDPFRIHVQWFDAALGTLGPDEVAASPGSMSSPPYPTVAVNETGDVLCGWVANGQFQWTRRDRASGAWSAVDTVSFPGRALGSFALTLDAVGTATGIWETFATVGSLGSLHAARLEATAIAWTAPIDLRASPGAAQPFSVGAVVDRQGVVTTVASVLTQVSATTWIEETLAFRYSPRRGTWSEHALAADGLLTSHVWHLSSAGDVSLAWIAPSGLSPRVRTARWRADLAPPAILGVTPSPGAVRIDLSMPGAAEPEYAPTSLEYTTDGGSTWSTAPASSPLLIGGLTDGIAYTVRLRTASGAGVGSATAALAVRSGTSTAPTGLRVAARAGQTLTFAWLAPAAGIVPESYVLQGGLAGTAQVIAAIPTGGAATQFTVRVPAGRFFVQVVGVSMGTLSSPPSNAPTIVTDDSSPPSTPAHVLASRGNGQVALSWTQGLDDGAVAASSLFIGGRAFASLRLAPTESITAGQPQSAFVQVFVSAANAAGVSTSAPAVTIDAIASCTTPPQAPTAFSASTQAGVAYLDWLPPTAGEAVSGYIVAVTGSFTGSFPMSARTLATPVPPGSYTIRVASVGLCGTSAPTAPQTLVVP